MTENHLEVRRHKYLDLSSQIARLDDAQLRSLFDNRELITGWGINHTIVLGQSQVFVKRIPVTNLEYENLFATKTCMNCRLTIIMVSAPLGLESSANSSPILRLRIGCWLDRSQLSR